MALKIVRNDITKMNTEAIVNTASETTEVGDGCDVAVYMAAGYDKLHTLRQEIGNVPQGEVFITPGFKLPAKYIIHAVSPLYVDGKSKEEEKLRSCYRKSLQLAKEKCIHSIAFPLISTGAYGYPKEEGMRIAVDEINDFLLKNDMEITLVVFDSKATQLGSKIYPDLEEYISQNYVSEKAEEEYGDMFYGAQEDQDPELKLRERRRRAMNMMPQMSSARANMAMPIEMDADEAVGAAFEDEYAFSGAIRDRIEHLEDPFGVYLLYLIESKGKTNSEVYGRAIITKQSFAKLKKNPKKYHPDKLTALQYCVGCELNIDETKDLLARAGYALSPADKRDIIFSYFITHEAYDMIDIDIAMEEHGLPCIIK